MLREGASVSSIARETAVSRQRVQHIKKRLLGQYVSEVQVAVQPPQPVAPGAGDLSSNLHMKALTLYLTPAVHDALTEACAIVNRQNPDDTITITEYVEELVINRAVELGLLRKNKRK